MSVGSFFLDSYAARSCAVKTYNHFNPLVDLPVGTVDQSLNELFEGGQNFKEQALAQIIEDFPGRLVDLRSLDEQPAPVQAAACVAAMSEAVDIIIGGLLPADPVGHRSGRPDLLVRVHDEPAGYRPVKVKFHKIQERRKSGRTNIWQLPCSALSNPLPAAAIEVPDVVTRASRANALLQLGHYWRLLEAAGFAANEPFGGIIGTDTVALHPDRDPEPVVTWIDLDEPVLRTFSRSAEAGWTKRSVLERYDHEHRFRVQVAQNALAQADSDPPEPLVTPIVMAECRTCPWWSHCRPQLHDDDISLRIDRSPLDVREISVLRARGIRTINDLAGINVDEFLPTYLPEVAHREQAEDRLRLAARRADLLVRGVTLERLPDVTIDLPCPDIEIDFDIETSSADRVYLWGYLVTDHRRPGPAEYVEFSAWNDLDDADEIAVARRSAAWLLHWLRQDLTVRVYHYSEYERTWLRRLAARSNDPLLREVCDYLPTHFVDMFPLVRQQWFGTDGLGLKVVAQEGAGFTWRDDAPGGLNSQAWFDEAAHADDETARELARVRVLEYNEDDVRATAAVRRWLREQNS